jgi:hypothetical protein
MNQPQNCTAEKAQVSYPSTPLPHPYINSTLTLNVLTSLLRNNLSARDGFLYKHFAPFLSMPSRLFSLHQVRSTCSHCPKKRKVILFPIYRLCFLPSISLFHLTLAGNPVFSFNCIQIISPTHTRISFNKYHLIRIFYMHLVQFGTDLVPTSWIASLLFLSRGFFFLYDDRRKSSLTSFYFHEDLVPKTEKVR